MVALLWRGSRRMGAASELDDRLRERLGRIVLAALAMGAVVWGAAWVLDPWLYAGPERYAALVGLIALGLVSYAAIGRILGAFSAAEIRGALRRQR